MAARIVKVEPREDGRAVVITLHGGTKIVDRLERIDVVGVAHDVAVDELVAAILRRGWDAVELHGSPAFRRNVSLRLRLVDPPVSIGDSPLTAADQVLLERIRATRSKAGMERASLKHPTVFEDETQPEQQTARRP